MAHKLKKLYSGLLTNFDSHLLKVFSFSALSTLVRMMTGFISVKFVSLEVGRAGIAVLGQLSNFSGIFLTIATGGIIVGITKYVSEYKHSDSEVSAFISVALRIVVIASLFLGILLVIASRLLSSHLMLTAKYSYVFTLFGISIILYSLNSMIIAIVNGFKSFRKFVVINICDSLVGLLFTLVLVYTWGLQGALVGAVTYQSIVFLVTLLLVRNEHWFNKKTFSSGWNNLIFKKFLGFSLMTLITALTLPLSQIFLRTMIIKKISLSEAGIWEGMNRLSNMYLMIITTSFSVYYLPRLSEIRFLKLLNTEIISAFKLILPIICIGFVLIFGFKDQLIRLLFSREFYSMRYLFGWQLLADFFKICSWIIAYLLIARSKMITFISLEIGFVIIYTTAASTLIHINGIQGACQAYLFTYILYFITCIIIFRKVLFIRKR